MAFFLLILLGLLGTGFVSTEVRNSQTHKLPETRGPSDSGDVYRQVAKEIREIIKSYRRIALVGQNEFEVALSRKLRHKVQTDLPGDRFMRVKRGFRFPECGVEDEIQKLVGKNDFESDTSPQILRRKTWDGLKESLADRNYLSGLNEIVVDTATSFPLEDCFNKRKLELFRTVMANLTLGADDRNIGNSKLFKMSPSNFITQYASKSKTGCGCDFNKNSIGCKCCFYWKDANLTICAGFGYIFKDMKFVVKINLQDFTLFSWEKEIPKSAFTKYLALFSKSLCIPHEFSYVITACLQLSLNFQPSFTKDEHSKIAACPSIIAHVFLFYDVMLLELPCWELEFDLPFLRIAGKGGMARLTYENNVMHLKEPVKTMFANEKIEAIGKIVYELGLMERNDSLRSPLNGVAGKIVEHIGEEPRLLMRGNATVPINWEPTEMSKLHYLVVLYTQPLPSPLTEADLNDRMLKEIPGFLSMMQDGLDRRFKDPSHLNLKVHASMGKSCGGVILTPNKILTLCACIKFFYLHHKYNRKPQVDDYQDLFTLVSSDIYVTFADRSFTADQIIYELDQDVDRFMKKSKCFDAIERTKKGEKSDTRSINLHMHMVVMSVTREFKKTEKLPLVPWLDMAGVKTTQTPAEMTVIGMRKSKPIPLFDAAGYEFDPLYQVVKVPFLSCPKTAFCRKGLDPTGSGGKSVPKEFDENTQCFCAKDQNFHLCDGVVGFPVITAEGLIGLNALPMHCRDEGSIVTALLSKTTVKEIEDYLSGRDFTTTSDPSIRSTTPPFRSTKRVDPLSPGTPQGSCCTLSASLLMTIISLLVLIPQ